MTSVPQQGRQGPRAGAAIVAASRARVLDLLGIAAAGIYALPSLSYPHGNDQALHWYVGQTLLEGGLPYDSAISGKPIGIFLIHALSSVLFGDGQMAIRLMEIPTLIAIAWLIVRLVREADAPARDGEWGAAAVLLAGIYYTFFDYWDTAHPELWEMALTLWAAHVALHEPRLVRRTLACGALGGAAFMVKYPAAIIALPVAAVCGLRAMALHARWSRRVIAVVQAAGLYLAGVAVAFGLCILPFAITGTLGPMWEVLVTLLTRYAGQAPGAPVGPAWVDLEHGGAALMAAGVFVFAGLIAALRRGNAPALLRGYFIVALSLAAFVSVILQGRYFPYHYVATAPLLAACIAFGLRQLLPSRAGIALGVSGLSVVAAFFAEPTWCTHAKVSYRTHTLRTLGYLDGSIRRELFVTAFVGNNYLDHYADHEHIGLEVRRRARPGDALCVRGFAPAIYQVAGLRCPSRLVMQPSPAGLPRWEIEFSRMLRTQRPRFVVTFDDRRDELRVLGRLGYQGTPMPTLYILMEHKPGELARRFRDIPTRPHAGRPPRVRKPPKPTRAGKAKPPKIRTGKAPKPQ